MVVLRLAQTFEGLLYLSATFHQAFVRAGAVAAGTVATAAGGGGERKRQRGSLGVGRGRESERRQGSLRRGIACVFFSEVAGAIAVEFAFLWAYTRAAGGSHSQKQGAVRG